MPLKTFKVIQKILPTKYFIDQLKDWDDLTDSEQMLLVKAYGIKTIGDNDATQESSQGRNEETEAESD